MSLIPWNPFRESENIGRELANLFDSTPFGLFGKLTSPRVDVYENKDNVVVKAEIPGVSKDDINVYLDENSIRISGQTKRDNEYKDETAYRVERFYGSFSRTVPLPVEVKSDQAKAEYKDGILSIVVPKVENKKMKGKKLEIQ